MALEIAECYTSDGIKIPGVVEIFPKIFKDSRGYTFEAYSERSFFQAGLAMHFVQENQTCSSKGALRGLHFQKQHPQGKLIHAVTGKIYDVCVDLRNDSPAFGKYFGTVLDSDRQNSLYLPEGFAHGFLTLSEQAVCIYRFTDFYAPEDEGGIIWNDKTVNVNWMNFLKGQIPVLSEKDTKHPEFSFANSYFSITGKWIGA